MTDETPAPPPAPAVPKKPPLVRAVGAMKWLGIVVLFLLGAWLVLRGYTDAGLAVLGLAMTQLGMVVDMTADQRRTLALVVRSLAIGAATAHGVRQVHEGVEEIRTTARHDGNGGDDHAQDAAG